MKELGSQLPGSAGDMHRTENPIMFPWEEKQAVLDREDGRLDWPIRIDGAPSKLVDR